MKSKINQVLVGIAFVGLAIAFATGSSPLTGLNKSLAYGGEIMGGCFGLYLIVQSFSNHFATGRNSEK